MKKFVILIFFLLNAIIFAGCSTEKILRRNLNHKQKTLWIQVPMLPCIPIWIFQRFLPISMLWTMAM